MSNDTKPSQKTVISEKEHLKENIDPNLKSTVYMFSFAGLIPFVYLALSAWVPQIYLFSLDPVHHFRLYSVVILSFLAGMLWVYGLIAHKLHTAVEIRTRTLLWSGILMSLLGWGNLFIDAKAALFVGAMLFLVVWQIEQKTELARSYPLWFANMRARLSMTVAICHFIIWLTIS